MRNRRTNNSSDFEKRDTMTDRRTDKKVVTIAVFKKLLKSKQEMIMNFVLKSIFKIILRVT